MLDGERVPNVPMCLSQDADRDFLKICRGRSWGYLFKAADVGTMRKRRMLKLSNRGRIEGGTVEI